MNTPAAKFETFTYHSTLDGIGPLYADVGFIADGKPKPVVAVLHGYCGDRKAVTLDVQELAAKGVVAIAPDMRGGNGSAGKFDSGGLEIHDIVDALQEACRRYPNEVQPTNLNVLGYSGGGGNALSAATRFPDLFHVAVSFFGISDYAFWYHSKGRVDCNERMVAALGGTPEELPDVYAARNTNLAAGNNGVTRIHLFWDEEETQCPLAMIEAFAAESQRHGHVNCVKHVSRKGDAHRWIHNYRSGNRDLSLADELFLKDVFAPCETLLALPSKGTLVVCGYLATHHFRVMIEDGQRGIVTVVYDLSGDKAKVEVMGNPKGLKVSITEGA